MFDNQNVVIIVVVLVIALIIGLVLVGFVLNNSDSTEDQVDTSAQLHLVPVGASATAYAPQPQLLTG
jgi:flagellar basal body-associated protein FliL